MQTFAIVVSLAIAVVGIALFVRAIRSIIGVMKVGQPARRTDNPAGRSLTMLKETLLHTRMLQWRIVGIAHWFVFVGFGLLFFTLLTAFGQLFDAHFTLPLIGTFFLYEWISELFTVVMLIAIIGFIAYRATRPTERTRGVKGRLWGSRMWQGYFVEAVILGVGLCIMVLRGLEYALLENGANPDEASLLHFPFTFWLGEAFSGLSTSTVENLIYLVAMLKILISFAWMITISVNLTMGVAWHRFLAFFNIWFRREPSGRTALGAVKPLTSSGKAITLDDIDDLDEDSVLGVGSVEDFSWKGILDFSSCTECGRCQSQCPAWNTEKPLSPKLLITALRDHAYAKAPYLQADSDEERATLLAGSDTLQKEVDRPLVGDTGDDWFYLPENGSAVIDPDVLWSCTSCGACVQQCPVDIEHVDHIIDMRRYAVLVESNFPAELNGLFKGLENKGNPWNMSPSARLDWAKGLDFEVKVVGETIESLDEVDWLFWVGCAGAYEDRAKKTTRAVAELLDMAGVSFGVLGNGETCTGDPARRAGNEFVFQGLAQQNVETFQEYKVKKVVSTCAHCFNTLKNEYKEFGVELEVVHHTQLLNRLVREGKLTPISEGAGAAKRSITYHDPCYIGRHNGVYTPPRELLEILPGADFVEMPRNSEKSFCCGAGGARMWMEENIGERINVNRTVEAVETGADQIAVGCPFCRVMLSDGLTAQQAKGEAREEVEVLDVAQMLLASVKGEVATKVKPAAAPAKTAARAAAPAAAPLEDEATKAEPDAGDVTQTADTVTDTEDVGPAAKASGGSSLFDEPAAPATSGGSSLFDEPAPATEPESESDEAPAAQPESKPASGGSLFDLDAPAEEAPQAKPTKPAETEAPAEATATTSAEAEPELGTGGSLFDLAAPVEDTKPVAEPAAKKAPKAEPAAKPASKIPEGGSLFDIATPDPAPAAATAQPEPVSSPAPEPIEAPTPVGTADAEPSKAPAARATPAAAPASQIPEGGSLFDIAAPEPAPAATAQPEVEAPEPGAEAEPTQQSTEDRAKSEPEPPKAQAARTTASAVPASEIPGAGSLFDIVAPEPAPGAKAESEAPTSTPTQADETSATDTSTSEDLSPGAAISAAATAAAGNAGEDEADTSADAPTEEPTQAEQIQPEAEQSEAERKPGAASNGAAHQPKTDVDINESGSLFDL
jgi:Fe-S oxidoreductase